jgi:signal transduction histidine kinase
MVIPLLSSTGTRGVLIVSRKLGGTSFSRAELRLAADFADTASVAIELARGRDSRARLALLEDRARIARDLHDHVIQRLFAAGLGLQALSGSIDSPDIRHRLELEVERLDDAVTEIRTAIFALTTGTVDARKSVRHRLLDVLVELGPLFTVTPRLVFTGPIDLRTPVDMADDLVAVVREGLSNVARHASASDVAITVSAEPDLIRVDILDDGVGIAGLDHSSGTDNLAIRAQEWGGEFSLTERSTGGTALLWTAPLTQVVSEVA